jgi:hypothetical protein
MKVRMNVLEDKKSSELLLQVNENDNFVISLHDGCVSVKTNLDLGEIETKKVENQYRFERITDESFSVGWLAKHDFRLKEVFYIPVNGVEIPFRVEHITDEKVYFVSVNAVGESTMTDMNDFLDDFMGKLPKDLLSIMGEIEHKLNGTVVRKSKVTLVSHGNLTVDECCNGVDDMLFDGMQTDAERCKNLDGKSCWRWTDSSSVVNSTHFLNVNTSGYPSSYYFASGDCAVCPCISILRANSVTSIL